MLLGAAQVCDPFLQDRLLVLLDACECDAHAHIGEDKCDAAERVNVAPSWEMRRRTCVPCGVGFSMSRKHPPILRSPVLAMSFVSNEISVTTASAMNG